MSEGPAKFIERVSQVEVSITRDLRKSWGGNKIAESKAIKNVLPIFLAANRCRNQQIAATWAQSAGACSWSLFCCILQAVWVHLKYISIRYLPPKLLTFEPRKNLEFITSAEVLNRNHNASLWRIPNRKSIPYVKRRSVGGNVDARTFPLIPPTLYMSQFRIRIRRKRDCGNSP